VGFALRKRGGGRVKNQFLRYVICERPQINVGRKHKCICVGYFQNGLKPFLCYVKISYATKEVDQRYLVFT
jgi:hypothetical protein